MRDIEREIDGVLERLRIPREQFERQGLAEGRRVVTAARDRFVVGDPRVWWLSPRLPCRTSPYAQEHWAECLRRELPPGTSACWLVIETDEGKEDLPVYRVQARHLPPVLGECSFFEYYVVGEHHDWLLIDTDHDELLFTEYRPANGSASTPSSRAPDAG